jgi:hypothetical protein
LLLPIVKTVKLSQGNVRVDSNSVK